MQGQLTQPEPIDLLRVETDVPDPSYLRAVTLDQYSDDGWGIGNLDGTEATDSAGDLVPLTAGVPEREVRARITALEHDDRFLPLFSSVAQVTVEDADGGEWRVDPGSGTVFGRDDARTSGRTWDEVAQEARPTPEQLAASPALPADDPVQQAFTALPELDQRVRDLVDGLTDPGQSPDERVRAVFDLLTDRANGFVYSLSTEPGTTGDDLADFLQLRRGYCEQYAGAMAVLVRAAGVPARVVLGYTPGEEQPDGSRLITSADAHAWVEVFYDGLGWVTFDPTPISEDRAVALPWAPRADDAAAQASAGAAAPTSGAAAPSAQLDRDDTATPQLAPAVDAGLPWGSIAAWGGGGVGALALLAVPAIARAAQRRRRLATGAPGAVWDELLAVAVDLGVPVRSTGTPRQLAADLVDRVGEDVAPAVQTLALALQREVYAPSSTGDGGDLTAPAGEVDRALRRSAGPRARVVARVLPASTLTDAADWLTAHRPHRPTPA